MHKSILVGEIKNFLLKASLIPQKVHVDVTLGFGGHLSSLLNSFGASDTLIALDRDKEALEYSKNMLAHPKIHYFNQPFSQLDHVLERMGVSQISSLLADLGISSYQIDQEKRGFSFLRDDILDMRMDQQQSVDARTVLNTYDELELQRIFSDHADFPRIDKLIQTILIQRQKKPYETSLDLVDTIKKSFYFRNSRKRYLGTCAQVFQAVRMEVNQELAELNALLSHIDQYLAPGGRVCFLTFHSIEDRCVKRFFSARKKQFELQGKVMKATQAEIKENSRAKCAKLRCYERVAGG